MADLALMLGGGAGIGGLSWLLNQIPGLGPSTKNINTDYANNPIWQQLFGANGEYAAKNKGMESFLSNAVSSAKAYDPNAFWKDFMAAQPEMQALISGPTDSFKSASMANLKDFADVATSETASNLSGMGSLYSGALGSIAGQKIGAEAGKSSTELAQLQASLLSQLFGGALSGFSSGEQFKTQTSVNTYLQGANTYSQQLMTMLGIGSDLSAPVYQQQPGLADSLMGGLGLGLQGYAALGMSDSGKKKETATSSFPSDYGTIKGSGGGGNATDLFKKWWS